MKAIAELSHLLTVAIAAALVAGAIGTNAQANGLLGLGIQGSTAPESEAEANAVGGVNSDTAEISAETEAEIETSAETEAETDTVETETESDMKADSPLGLALGKQLRGRAAASAALSHEFSSNQSMEKIEELRQNVPETYSETEAKISGKGKFLMWTRDLEHIMWGRYGNGYFVGQDNEGKKAWGVYGSHYFAGFYDGQFFYGKYGYGHWKAVGLFGEERASGRFVLYHPRAAATSMEASGELFLEAAVN